MRGSPHRKLGALARAYAQLGILSEYQWNPAHKAYKARALLYAQRCLAKVPESPEGLRSRAFALASVGRARDARTDLDFAIERSRAKDAPEGQGREPAPVEGWAELIDAFLKADLERLNNFEGPDAKLARLLQMVALEFPRHTSMELDPLSTYALATLIEYDWPRYKDKAKEWEQASTRSLALAKVFAERYMDERHFDVAETYWKRAIAIYPDDTSYEELAESYKARGDVARWKETLDEYLDKVEDHGLNHAGVRVKIADEFMKQKRWKEARPYADAAAETWAGWAMACASRCAEGMEDWESAELWMRRVSERYPRSSYLNWFKLCSRTGHGDIKAAAAFAEECFADFGKDVPIQDLPEAGYFFWASGSLKKASEIFEKCVSQGEKGTTTMVHLASSTTSWGTLAVVTNCSRASARPPGKRPRN
ncbi:hypothetical protein [Singulisphaera sp. PoT]|uniref:tetratricopeptide repeat protein n=1 Tax=Singulisphaera sp. PoT TaxID=3411797 RepID=UPI003BF5166B